MNNGEQYQKKNNRNYNSIIFYNFFIQIHNNTHLINLQKLFLHIFYINQIAANHTQNRDLHLHHNIHHP
jgi:hypothetical protein